MTDKPNGKPARNASKKPKTPAERRARLNEIKHRRNTTSAEARGDGRNYSLEGMRFATLLNQLQALQAVQGLSEMAPKKKRDRERFEFAENEAERAAQYQWLLFKADWLEALLEDTVDQLDALVEFERNLKNRNGKAAHQNGVDAKSNGKEDVVGEVQTGNGGSSAGNGHEPSQEERA